MNDLQMNINIDIQANDPAVVAIMGKNLANWSGGNDYLRLCMSGLTAVSPSLQPFLLLPELNRLSHVRRQLGRIKRGAMNSFRSRKFVCQPTLNKLERTDVFDALKGDNLHFHVVSYTDSPRQLRKTLETLHADVAFPALETLGSSFSIPWVGYIPDFQHRYLPQFFTEKECISRDRTFGRIVNDAKAICLNSRSVAEDVRKFYPSSSCKLFVLPFAPCSMPEWLEGDHREVCGRYSLPVRFFLISNQFWIHKSHITAFKALHFLRAIPKFRDVEIICTGTTHDYRWPHYFNELKAEVESFGLTDSIRFLGRIPKLDQIAIMKKSVAVVQPTLFEGGPGGGSVYDAVAVGTHVIASDISVNREIENPLVTFFKAGSAENLASAMQDMLAFSYDSPNAETLKQLGFESQKSFGNVIMSALRYAIST